MFYNFKLSATIAPLVLAGFGGFGCKSRDFNNSETMAAKENLCINASEDYAQAFLSSYVASDSRLNIEKPTKLEAIKDPTNDNVTLDKFKVIGHADKVDYEVQFLFTQKSCNMRGMEIHEVSSEKSDPTISVAQCESNAKEQAKSLLANYYGSSEQMNIIDKTVILSPLENSRNGVIEVTGNIDKKTYRMRFIYLNTKNLKCTLVGKEIFELTTN